MNSPTVDKARHLTVRGVLKKTTDFFAARKIENPRLNIELLLCHVLSCQRMDLYLDLDKPLNNDEITRLRTLVKKRGTRMPIQYLTGECEFLDFRVALNQHVIIPRPETELLASSAMADIPERGIKSVLDLGTGSGVLAICVKRGFPELAVFGSDVSEKALFLAEENGKANGVAVHWVLSDGFAHLAGKSFDLVISNPPYIKTEDFVWLESEVRDFEPRLALDGGPNGLTFFERFFSEVPEFLNRAGRVHVEVGAGQSDRVSALGEASQMRLIRVEQDLAGIDRVVVFEKK